MRASTVMRSMPTSETRTQASITIPLSRTRSRTSMRLVPPAARSTAILCSCWRAPGLRSLSLAAGRRRGRQRFHLSLELPELCSQLLRPDLRRPALGAGGQVAIVAPPVQSDFLGLIQGTDQQTDTDCEELDLGQRNFDVS